MQNLIKLQGEIDKSTIIFENSAPLHQRWIYSADEKSVRL